MKYRHTVTLIPPTTSVIKPRENSVLPLALWIWLMLEEECMHNVVEGNKKSDRIMSLKLKIV